MTESSEGLGGTGGPEVRRLPALPLRVVQVFTSPIRLFEALRAEPRAWGALFLGALIAAGSNALIPAELWDAMIRNQILQAGGEVPAQIGMAGNFARIAGTAGALISFPIMGALSAGVSALIFLFAFGYEGRFRQYFAVTAHALLVLAVGGAVLTPLRVLTENVQFTVSLGGLLPFLGDSLPGRFLNLVDLFTVWVMALIGVGAATIDGKRNPGSAAAISVGALLLILLLFASFGAGARGG